jgi:parallel beta-helix repeat protein
MRLRGSVGHFPLLGLLGASLLATRPAAAALPTPVDHCPVTIDTPGDYVVTQDLTCSANLLFTGAIQINASNVHLFLQGHTLTGPGSGSYADGIGVGYGQSGVTITGPGTITGFSQGVNIGGSGSTVQNLVISNNGAGITINNSTANQNTIQHNVLSNNAFGMDLGGNASLVQFNDASNNSTAGILLLGGTAGNLIQHNRAFGNRVDLEGNCVNQNVWQFNLFGTADQPCIH